MTPQLCTGRFASAPSWRSSLALPRSTPAARHTSHPVCVTTVSGLPVSQELSNVLPLTFQDGSWVPDAVLAEMILIGCCFFSLRECLACLPLLRASVPRPSGRTSPIQNKDALIHVSYLFPEIFFYTCTRCPVISAVTKNLTSLQGLSVQDLAQQSLRGQQTQAYTASAL